MKIAMFLGVAPLLVAISAYAADGQCPPDPYVLDSLAGYDHLRYAPIQRERIYDGYGFIASVDGQDDDDGDGLSDFRVQPEFVAYHTRRYRSHRGSMYPPAMERPPRWYELPMFDVERQQYQVQRPIDASYTGSGNSWNRGHLAPRATMNRISPFTGCNSHVHANAVPQSNLMNGGIWLALENYVASLANQFGDAWDVSGPIFIPGKPIDYIGDRGEVPIPIPHALFKVIFIEDQQQGQLMSMAFILPNVNERMHQYKTGNCAKDQHYNINSFLVSIADVEANTGLTFLSDDDALEGLKLHVAAHLLDVSISNEVGYCKPVVIPIKQASNIDVGTMTEDEVVRQLIQDASRKNQ